MALAKPFRANIVLNYSKIPHTRLIIPKCPCHQRTRLFSSGIQWNQRIPRESVFRTTPSSRNYWWSSSAASVPSPPLSTPPQEPSIPHSQPTGTTSHEPLQATPNTAIESAVQCGPVAESVKSPPSSLESVTAPDASTDIAIADLVPPLQFGDFAELGLSGWSPPGIVAKSFEWMQVCTGMPWFYTIIAGTIFWRLALVYPYIENLRASARLLNAPRVKKATEAFKAAKASGDKNQQSIAQVKLSKAYKDIGVNILFTTLGSFIQAVSMFALFFAVKRMCELPVEQLKHSGVSFIPDLTLVSGTAAFDPYYVMPMLGAVALNLQLKFSAENLDAERPFAAHVMNIFRILSPLTMVLMAYLPAGVILSGCTGIGYSVVQVAVCRLPLVRQKLNIPRLPSNATVPPSLWDTVKWAQGKAPEVLVKLSSFTGRRKIVASEKIVVAEKRVKAKRIHSTRT